jgi:hypothetical protein
MPDNRVPKRAWAKPIVRQIDVNEVLQKLLIKASEKDLTPSLERQARSATR